MNLLMPGMYVAADSPLHRLDPRVKMATATLLMALPFAAPSWQSGLVLAGFIAAIARLAAVPPLALLRTLRTVVWIGAFMFVFYAFTTPGQPLIALGQVTVTRAGLIAAGGQIYRLCALVIMASLLSYTTSPAQLAHGLEATLGPLARLGLPVREFAMVLTIALRFVPTLTQEIDKIRKAQRARGIDWKGGPWRRVQSWVPTFVPIFVSAFRRAEQLAVAMEARGFRDAARRTRLHQLHLGRQDAIASIIVLAVSLAVVGVGWLDAGSP
jgi:energy-coupling factor transport system permease protein